MGDKLLDWSDIDSLFRDEEEETPAPQQTVTSQEQPTSTEQQPDVTQTQAFSKRLKESTQKAVDKEREAIAVQMGFTSYDEMIKSRETKVLEDQGLDPELAKPAIDKIVEERLNSDPRMQELQKLRERQIKEYGERELAEITKLTDGEITSFKQLPQDVVELWKTTGSLKAAYMQLHGEELVIKAKSSASRGTTDHLVQPSGSSVPQSNKRLLTDEEKRMFKLFNPNVTDEELNKKTYDVKNN